MEMRGPKAVPREDYRERASDKRRRNPAAGWLFLVLILIAAAVTGLGMAWA